MLLFPQQVHIQGAVIHHSGCNFRTDFRLIQWKSSHNHAIVILAVQAILHRGAFADLPLFAAETPLAILALVSLRPKF
jgi:hypothetical protein